MKQIWTGRAVQVAAKYGDHAPMAAACCNACRTCTTTNLVGLGMAALTGAGLAASKFVRRFTLAA